ncbi:restriction endonuclease subunit S [Heyndrickxia faecalis]|uniref:restriction endonuclease subunit S n=1 Tax=Heyndrickxia faecalis TaxID=2824910 RepID=UPI002E1F2C07|nr:restriction endonuclease subunit S [Weizmannia sp. CD-2023]MED4975665.1 restriction endonuclease subunit S [Weizmannia sp. CD-2023]
MKYPKIGYGVSLNAIAKFINGDRGKNYPSQKDFVHEGIPFINAGHLVNGKIKKYIFPLPPLAEQERIVEKLNRVIGNMENEQFAIDKALKGLEQLKNSILSKAFRGELGTNDPTEESAIELLKEVLQEQTN